MEILGKDVEYVSYNGLFEAVSIGRVRHFVLHRVLYAMVEVDLCGAALLIQLLLFYFHVNERPSKQNSLFKREIKKKHVIGGDGTRTRIFA